MTIKNKKMKQKNSPFRITKPRNEKYSYAIGYIDAHKIRMLGVIGLVSLFMLIVGMYYFVTQSSLIALCFTPFFVLVIFYNLVNYLLMSQFPSFSLFDHGVKVSEFKRAAKFPKVAVLIPAAGEHKDVVRKTMLAALKMDYPNFTVFVLDDSETAMYKELVHGSGAKYFRRKDIGYHKKAGNLNALLNYIDGYEYLLVLDADFVPRIEMLSEVVPYAGPDVSIVQTPQHFDLNKHVYRRSKIEYGAALIQQDFYRITQPARNRVGGAICVGTNALYRLDAIKAVGGFEGVGSKRTGGHSEDVFTGLKTLNTVNERGRNYQIKYVPIALAKGVCPSDHLSFYKQQHRWATGSMQLIMSPKTLFSKHLSLSQKMCYFSNSTYYFYTIALLLSPLQLLVLGLTNSDYSWQALLLFIPSLILNYVLVPFVLRKSFSPFAAALVVISNAYTFLQALYLLLIKKPLGWEATGASNSTKKHIRFAQFKVISALSFLGIYVGTLMVLLLHHKIGMNASIIMVGMFGVSIAGHIVYLHYLFTMQPLQTIKKKIKRFGAIKKQDVIVAVNES